MALLFNATDVPSFTAEMSARGHDVEEALAQLRGFVLVAESNRDQLRGAQVITESARLCSPISTRPQSESWASS